jgi:hypothetical protein
MSWIEESKVFWKTFGMMAVFCVVIFMIGLYRPNSENDDDVLRMFSLACNEVALT